MRLALTPEQIAKLQPMIEESRRSMSNAQIYGQVFLGIPDGYHIELELIPRKTAEAMRAAFEKAAKKEGK